MKVATICSGDGTQGGQPRRERPTISRRVVDNMKDTLGGGKRDAGKANGATIRPAFSLPGNDSSFEAPECDPVLQGRFRIRNENDCEEEAN